MKPNSLFLSAVCGAAAAAAAEPCVEHARVGSVTVWSARGALLYSAGLAIDADGAPDAYGPDGKGKDHLANAGKPGNWWGLATRGGEPVVQGPSDPAPGFYVSTTALEDRRFAPEDPRRYVDSGKVPYVVLPPKLLKTARLGDFAVVLNEQNGRLAYALVADVGPRDKLGEGSMALAEALGVPSDPKRGGAGVGLRYAVFPRSGDGRPRPVEELAAEGARLLSALGRDQLTACR